MASQLSKTRNSRSGQSRASGRTTTVRKPRKTTPRAKLGHHSTVAKSGRTSGWTFKIAASSRNSSCNTRCAA